MHYFDERIQRLTEDFKIECLQVIAEEEITRQEIADALGVNHTTISRWFSSGDLHFPACLVPALNTPHLKPLAASMLHFQTQRLGYSLSRRISAQQLNGDIQDEVCDVVQHLGRAVQAVKDGKISLRNCRKELEGVIEAAQQAMQELDGMEKH